MMFPRKWRGPRRRSRAAWLARRKITPQERDFLAQATIKRFRQTTAGRLPWWTKGTNTFDLLVHRVDKNR